ncbi:MAG: hypothetical protein NDJ89_07070 [Oligoflexia bacterium]|nr:hypothetical protein [Oligoflexia bacterium]
MAQARIDYPRDLAVRVLTRVLSDRMPLDEALAGLPADLSPGARGWLQEVCAGTLRWKGRLDLVIDSTALKKKPSGWLRKVLLIAAYQLIAQERTQPGVVVSETVSEVKRKEGEAPSKFANAILRKIAEHGKQWRELAPRTGGPEAELAAWASLPDWLWSRLVKQHGAEWAEAYARASLERPGVWIRARRTEWKPGWAEAGPVPGAYRITSGGAIPEREGFAEGEFIVQDISSQLLISEVAREVRAELGPGSLRALDLCAAPGGKSIGLAWSGFQVIASDRDEGRLGLLRQTVSRAAPREVRILSKPQLAEVGPQDLVWVDAPCSGSGILRRHPDVRWLRRENELKGLLEVQAGVLKEGWQKLRPGGYLVYSVCSILKEEGPEALERSELQGYCMKSWELGPHLAPFGDGFWAGLLKKP